MIVVAPPQQRHSLRYVLLCDDGATFVLSINEAIRAQCDCHVPFEPWWSVSEIDKARAISAVRQEQALERRTTNAA